MLETNHHSRPLIFLAEDDEDDAFFLRTALNQVEAECDLVHFFNATELIQALLDPANRQPIMVLLDLHMPGMEGMETLNFIRKNISAHLPIIIFTMISDPEVQDACLKEGANAYYTKPHGYHRYLEIFQKLRSEYFLTEQV